MLITLAVLAGAIGGFLIGWRNGSRSGFITAIRTLRDET